jgi:hypothetical protein
MDDRTIETLDRRSLERVTGAWAGRFESSGERTGGDFGASIGEQFSTDAMHLGYRWGSKAGKYVGRVIDFLDPTQ